MSQTTPITVMQKPFTPAERKLLDKIVEAPAEKRNKMKLAFREKHNRRRQDVHNYVYKRVHGLISKDAMPRRRGAEKAKEAVETSASFRRNFIKAYQSPTSPRELKIKFTIKKIEWSDGKMILTAQSD